MPLGKDVISDGREPVVPASGSDTCKNGLYWRGNEGLDLIESEYDSLNDAIDECVRKKDDYLACGPTDETAVVVWVANSSHSEMIGEPVYSSGSDGQAPEPTPSDGTIVVRTAHEFTVDGKCRDITGFFVGRDEDYLQAWSVREFLEPYEPFGIYYPDVAMYGSFVGPGTKLFVFYFAPYRLVWDEVNSLAGTTAPSPEPATAEKKEGN